MRQKGSFWCNECHAWTFADRDSYDADRPRCDACGDNYACGECGYIIDSSGTCLRPSEEVK